MRRVLLDRALAITRKTAKDGFVFLLGHMHHLFLRRLARAAILSGRFDTTLPACR